VVAYTTAGNYGVCWVIAGMFARRPLRTATTVWGTLGANYGVKRIVDRERPAADGSALIPLPGSPSFPSSHAAMSVAAAIVLSRAAPRRTPLWVLAATLMCASRVYVGAHHRSDVAAGVVVGVIGGAVGASV
jgi:undecaprenyl-diphosphatase